MLPTLESPVDFFLFPGCTVSKENALSILSRFKGILEHPNAFWDVTFGKAVL